MLLTITLTDGTETTLWISLAQYSRIVADFAAFTAEGSPTWGEYRDRGGVAHHVEFTEVTSLLLSDGSEAESEGGE